MDIFDFLDGADGSQKAQSAREGFLKLYYRHSIQNYKFCF